MPHTLMHAPSVSITSDDALFRLQHTYYTYCNKEPRDYNDAFKANAEQPKAKGHLAANFSAIGFRWAAFISITLWASPLIRTPLDFPYRLQYTPEATLNCQGQEVRSQGSV